MKNTFFILLSLILFSSCEDNPTKIIEVGVDKYQYIETYPFNRNIFIRDNDTLKIEILDSNVVNQIVDFVDILKVTAQLSDEGDSESHWVYETITSDLSIERNPEKTSEFWVFGFQANIDSNRRFINSRFDFYYMDLEYSNLSPYYYDKNFVVYVESSTE